MPEKNPAKKDKIDTSVSSLKTGFDEFIKPKIKPPADAKKFCHTCSVKGVEDPIVIGNFQCPQCHQEWKLARCWSCGIMLDSRHTQRCVSCDKYHCNSHRCYQE